MPEGRIDTNHGRARGDIEAVTRIEEKSWVMRVMTYLGESPNSFTVLQKSLSCKPALVLTARHRFQPALVSTAVHCFELNHG
jgi:DNA-binding HxlR family transcriptional regulator